MGAKATYIQEHIIACQLCPDIETMQQVEMTNPSDAEYASKVGMMLEHFKQAHGLTDDECKALKVRPVAFLDGDQGWAQQKKNWILPATDTTPERIVAGYQWTRERAKTK